MKKKLILIISLMVGLFTACSKVNGPEQIASYRQEEPIAVYTRTVDNLVIYNATLDMSVSNVERTTERVKEVAFEHGGYLVNAQSWYRDGEKHTTVVLAVPAYRFDQVRDEVLRLGDLTGEWISSELVSPGSLSGDSYAHITIYLHPKESAFAGFWLPKWRPVRTLEKAWGVFVSIFGFLLDILIWLVVVAGPFVLIGWGAVKVYRLWHRKAMANKKEPGS